PHGFPAAVLAILGFTPRAAHFAVAPFADEDVFVLHVIRDQFNLVGTKRAAGKVSHSVVGVLVESAVNLVALGRQLPLEPRFGAAAARGCDLPAAGDLWRDRLVLQREREENGIRETLLPAQWAAAQLEPFGEFDAEQRHQPWPALSGRHGQERRGGIGQLALVEVELLPRCEPLAAVGNRPTIDRLERGRRWLGGETARTGDEKQTLEQEGRLHLASCSAVALVVAARSGVKF